MRGLSSLFVLKTAYRRVSMSSSLSTASQAQTTPATSSLLINQAGNTTVLTLNRPKALNALDLKMCEDVRDLLLNWHRKAIISPGAFIVKGAGGKAFCAGGDVKSIWQEIVTAYPKEVPVDDLIIGSGKPGTLSTDFFATEYHMNYLLGTSKIPQISFWDGIVMGGGVGISVLGEFRVATEKTLFAMPETAIGLFPDVGCSAWLPHLKSGFGNYIGLTGARLKGVDLLYAGIATHYVPSENLPELEAEIIKVVTEDPVESKKEIKAVLKRFKIAATEEFLSQSFLKTNEDLINRVFHDAQSIEAILAALQAESEKGSEFAKATHQTLSKMSPVSLKVALEQLRRGKDLDLKAGLEMEFRIMMRSLAHSDFREGIRSVLVDKDNKAVWSSSLESVTPEIVDKYFQPLGKFELALI